MRLPRFFTTPLSTLLGARPPVGAAPRQLPPIGTTLCCNQFRMTVQAGFSRDLWQWLVAQGWRVLPSGDNRYRYQALPSNVIAALADAEPDAREKLLALALRRALKDDGAAAKPVRAAA